MCAVSVVCEFCGEKCVCVCLLCIYVKLCFYGVYFVCDMCDAVCVLLCVCEYVVECVCITCVLCI